MASRTGVGWIFAWMARRTAAAYGLLGEALALLHEQKLGLSDEAHRLVLFNAIAASRYLTVLLKALRPSLWSLDDGALLVALADLGSRHRPRAGARQRSRTGYVRDLLAQSVRETAKVRRFLVCVGERNSAVVEGLDEAGHHVEQASLVLDGRSIDVLRAKISRQERL